MSEKWIRDTGLVFGLFFLILGVWKGTQSFLLVSTGLLVAVLFIPSILTPVAWVWLKVAEVLGFVMNRVFFGLVFFVVVFPVGLFRRIFKGDERDLTPHPNKKSAFIDRDHVVTPENLAKPY